MNKENFEDALVISFGRSNTSEFLEEVLGVRLSFFQRFLINTFVSRRMKVVKKVDSSCES